ncbi:MAG: hypothetical protein AAFR11_00170 [Pseudomonadota bacterium]
MSDGAVRRHASASAVAVDADGPLLGALFLGPSGAGKSDLVLRLIDGCPWRRARLVADDQVLIGTEDGPLLMRPPDALHGTLEVRGVGLLSFEPATPTALTAVFDLVAAPERLPEPKTVEIVPGAPPTPLFALSPFEASAPAKVRAALRTVFCGQSREGAHHEGLS